MWHRVAIEYNRTQSIKREGKALKKRYDDLLRAGKGGPNKPNGRRTRHPLLERVMEVEERLLHSFYGQEVGGKEEEEDQGDLRDYIEVDDDVIPWDEPPARNSEQVIEEEQQQEPPPSANLSSPPRIPNLPRNNYASPQSNATTSSMLSSSPAVPAVQHRHSKRDPLAPLRVENKRRKAENSLCDLADTMSKSQLQRDSEERFMNMQMHMQREMREFMQGMMQMVLNTTTMAKAQQ